jgi:hypothetical protein
MAMELRYAKRQLGFDDGRKKMQVTIEARGIEPLQASIAKGKVKFGLSPGALVHVDVYLSFTPVDKIWRTTYTNNYGVDDVAGVL